MSDRNSPIGILDSGIGGFSAVKQLQRLLPGEELLYFGDGAHVPYGNHSGDTITALSRYMFRFMAERGTKALVVACNTISCLVDRCADLLSCPAFDTVQAGTDAVLRLAAERGVDRVGIISTVFTHSSGIYPRRILARSPRALTILSRGCPDLARLIEHGLGDPQGMARVEAELHRELDHMVLEDRADCCVLGCTHYPLVADRIRRMYPDLLLIDPAEEIARAVKSYLAEADLLRPGPEPGRLTIYTTGDAEEYALRARLVGLERVADVIAYPPMEIAQDRPL